MAQTDRESVAGLDRHPSPSLTGIPVSVDDRERRGSVYTALEASGAFVVEVERLTLGDYLVDNTFLFERKTLPDLAESIKQGRLFSQALRLVESKLPVALILEGTKQDLVNSRMRREAIQGALVMLTLFIGLPRHGRRSKGKTALQRYILQGFPGISPERAARLLKRFGSIEAVLRADSEVMAEVPAADINSQEKSAGRSRNHRPPIFPGCPGLLSAWTRAGIDKALPFLTFK